jgi:hypothetical protein
MYARAQTCVEGKILSTESACVRVICAYVTARTFVYIYKIHTHIHTFTYIYTQSQTYRYAVRIYIGDKHTPIRCPADLKSYNPPTLVIYSKRRS